MLKQQPRWVRWVWDTPIRRLGLSCVFLALASWILISAALDAESFLARPYTAGGFLAAPALFALFGTQAAEAVGDVATGRDRDLPVFHRFSQWIDRHIWLAVAYLVVMIGALLLAR